MALPRHAISDENWQRLEPLLPGRPGDPGWVAQDNRRFLDAVLWIAKTGAPWRDLPERLGKWNSQWRRFSRLCRKGYWERILAVLQDPDVEWLILDSTVVRAHPCAAGAPKKRMAPEARMIRPSAAAGAASAPRFTVLSAASVCP